MLSGFVELQGSSLGLAECVADDRPGSNLCGLGRDAVLPEIDRMDCVNSRFAPYVSREEPFRAGERGS
jgi:hypothetical protein